MVLRLNTSHSRAAAGQLSTAVALGILALVLSLITRFALLDHRVMHTDEAVQAEIYLAPMLNGGAYEYRGADGHGPLLVYSTRVLCWLTGVGSPSELNESLLRITPALYSVALVLLVWLMADGLGRGATAWASLFTALSPMMVYYSRYYIMEVPLVFMTTLAIAAGWRYSVSRHPAWMVVAGAAVGLMHVTKETFLIQLIAGGLALLATRAFELVLSGTGYGRINRSFARRRASVLLVLVLAAAVAAGISFLLFSGFFTKPGQFFDSFRSYVSYAQRAEGAGHEKPWWWYGTLLWGRRDADGFLIGEWPLILLAAVGAGKAFTTRPTRYENVRLQRFLAFYAAALFCGYSIIAYKTPWTILGAEHAIILLAGLGSATLIDRTRGPTARFLVWAALATTAGYLSLQIWRQNFRWPADPAHNPYVYSHTSPDVLRLVRQVNDTAHARGGPPSDFNVFIIHPESGYPLPWYFRHLGGGATTEMPEDSSLLTRADVIITVPEAAPLLGALVSSTHREIQETWLLRPDTPLRALFRRTLLGDLPRPAPPASPPPLPARTTPDPSEPDPAGDSEPPPAIDASSLPDTSPLTPAEPVESAAGETEPATTEPDPATPADETNTEPAPEPAPATADPDLSSVTPDAAPSSDR